MKAIYLDCIAGISGNMLLGAFLQAGVPAEHLAQELKKIPLPDPYHIHIEHTSKNGIQAIHLDVDLPHEEAGHHHEGEHHHHHHHHRTMREIRLMLEESTLSEAVKKTALDIFECLAEAEGKVHGRRRDEVTFHEVGAVDSIIDIVGCAICLDYLEIKRVFVSRVNVGSGFVECAHGLMMVPAPATAELLKGFATYSAGAERELTTPTGAAVVHALAEYSEHLPMGFHAERIAYGAGTWDLDIPNVLRMYVGDFGAAPEQRAGRKYLLETNIDDMSPQIFSYLYDRLFEAGALDVWATPIHMKKNRPAVMLSVLAEEPEKDACIEIIFEETTAIGLRTIPVERRVEADRRVVEVKTRYGSIHCKASSYQGRPVTVSAEYEDCRRAAEEHHVPLKEVQQEAICRYREANRQE